MRHGSIGLLLTVTLFACHEEKQAPPTPPEPEQGRVKITSEPSGAAVLVDGRQRVGRTPLLLERPSFTRLEVVLVKDGYELLRIGRVVEPGNQVRIHGVLRPKQGQVIVRAGPIHGAIVSIDGVVRGKTPSRLSLEANGEHVIQVSKDGFQPWLQAISVKAGEIREVLAVLVPKTRRERPMGWLVVEADQPAVVFINDAPLGATPLGKVPLPARSYKLRVNGLKSRRSKSLSVTIRPGQVRTVKVRLEK